MPVKSEPGGGIAADNSGYVGDQGAGAVALDDTYADENYDYGAYGEAGYDDGSGMIDPNTGLPLAGADGNKGEHLLSIFKTEMCFGMTQHELMSGFVLNVVSFLLNSISLHSRKINNFKQRYYFSSKEFSLFKFF